MKKIDIKSALIGVFFTTTVIFALGATGKKDKEEWDPNQVWKVDEWSPSGKIDGAPGPRGYEPFALVGKDSFGSNHYAFRKRIK